MTDLQKIQFEMLKIFIDICNKESLQYFLVCGSALGAVKYNGFIPWDDDIDVALPREDYEKFLLSAPDYLPEWCFLQNYRTDLEFPLLGTKLRDSRTTYIEKMCGELHINHGVFIDVFPLDCHWKEHSNLIKFKLIHREFEGKRRVHLEYDRFCRGVNYPIQTFFYYLMNRFLGLYEDTSIVIKKYDDFLKCYNQNGKYWCNYANSSSLKEYALKEQYGEGIIVKFEGLDVRIPEKYNEYLEQKYGDWNEELPIEEQKGHHYYEVCDLDNPYTIYIKND